MAKTWQYGRWRGVALQVMMWLIFGSSLGLAAYIDHRRSGTLGAALAEPRTFGRLSVRLPKDWSMEGEAGPPQALVVRDLDRQGRERRTLRITQEQQGERRRGSEYYLETLIGGSRFEIPVEPEPFPFLGQDDAVLMPLRFSLRGRVPEGVDLGLPQPGLYACAVLPDGLTVTVQVVGEGAYGPSSRRLLRMVADNVRLADSPAASGPNR